MDIQIRFSRKFLHIFAQGITSCPVIYVTRSCMFTAIYTIYRDHWVKHTSQSQIFIRRRYSQTTCQVLYKAKKKGSTQQITIAYVIIKNNAEESRSKTNFAAISINIHRDNQLFRCLIPFKPGERGRFYHETSRCARSLGLFIPQFAFDAITPLSPSPVSLSYVRV